jgi:hypothetical protein
MMAMASRCHHHLCRLVTVLAIATFLCCLQASTTFMVNGKAHTKQFVARQGKKPMRNPNLNHHRTKQTKRAYDPDQRSSVLRRQAASLPVDDNHGDPCSHTIARWKARQLNEGHFLPFLPNGNKRATVFVGVDLLLLCVYRLIFPEARAAEIIAFLYNTLGHFYSRSQVSEAEMNVGLSRKSASSTARQALQPRVKIWCSIFWHVPEPFGMPIHQQVT